MPTTTLTTVITPEYSEQYIEACFRAWYDAGCPKAKSVNGETALTRVVPPDENGNKPHTQTILKWMNKYNWRERAAALDDEVSVRLDQEAIAKRIQTLRELADTGQKVMDRGLDYILNEPDPFADNPSAAVRAIALGSEMKAKYMGQAELLANISGMSDKQIETEILRLLGKDKDDENNENETIESSLEDIPGDEDASADSEDDNSPGE